MRNGHCRDLSTLLGYYNITPHPPPFLLENVLRLYLLYRLLVIVGLLIGDFPNFPYIILLFICLSFNLCIVAQNLFWACLIFTLLTLQAGAFD